MRTIGLLGGMSWESTAVYYRRINEQIRDRLGGLHSAEVLMRSVDFDKIVALQQADAWDKAGAVLAGFARDLEAAGAACIVICTNTMHKLADTVQSAVTVPLLHIADVTGQAVKAAGVSGRCCSRPATPWSRTSICRNCGPSTASPPWCRMPRTAPAFTTSSSANSVRGS